MVDASVRGLLDGHWYDAVAALLTEGLPGGPPPGVDPARLRRARDLATAAKRVLDLDAEDFGTIAGGFSRPWAHRLAESCFPLGPRDSERGALTSLVPLYELMLEVMQLRALRHEPLQVVVTAHLIGEYLCQLAWESTLGHGGDPLRMRRGVGERWGTDDRSCPHSSALRATAKRSLNACNGDVPGYTAYLDKFHSRLGDALAVCAMNHETIGAGERPDVGETCPDPCGWATRGSLERRRDLDARVRLALVYVDSPIVALRHHAPVGHFFGVPSVQEISEAWLRTWERLSQPWNDGANPLLLGQVPGAGAPDEALPGMSALVSAVAGRTVGAGRVIRDIGEDIVATLDGE
ncbi:hypothetical protein CGZ93_03755 [Enemella dayhoffiae]|uniref:Uncharacterized protein n=1 Tax=Enemella dayhoffiae TaxID=2016507 RepID=A0A255H9W9_9ACTN|nr:hypothetical protein [Enemella dayhoffiae]OYO24511.1 hypothetical protein CGZ93_03755 [Enemella dayhoffiae]